MPVRSSRALRFNSNVTPLVKTVGVSENLMSCSDSERVYNSDAAQPVEIANAENVFRHHRIYVNVVAVNVGLGK